MVFRTDLAVEARELLEKDIGGTIILPSGMET